MNELPSAVATLVHSANTLFLLLGTVMVLAMQPASPFSKRVRYGTRIR